MWENVHISIQIIESQIDSNSKTTDLYDSQYCPKDNEDCAPQFYHNIQEFVQMKKPVEFCMGLNHTIHPLIEVYTSS